jgi:MoxR-like ATPase
MKIVEHEAGGRQGSGAVSAETLEFVRKVRERVGKVVVGQDVVVERLLIALFTGGHLLLQGVPGLAKTLLVATLSRTIDLHFARIQFTVDLLPSDILGSEILDQRSNDFLIQRGRSSRTCCWRTKSTAPRQRCRARCWKRCRNAR